MDLRERATLDLIRELYVADQAATFPGAALAVLGRALRAHAGYVAVRRAHTDEWAVAHTLGPRVKAEAVEAALTGWRGAPRPGGWSTATLSAPRIRRLAAPFGPDGAPEVAVLVAEHRRLGTSLWVLALEALDQQALDRLRLLPVHLGYAGELALPRAIDALALPAPPAVPAEEQHRVDDLFPVEGGHRIRAGVALAELPNRVERCLRLAARGLTNIQIGQQLGVSAGTVARDLKRGYDHLGITRRRELNTMGLLSPAEQSR